MNEQEMYNNIAMKINSGQPLSDKEIEYVNAIPDEAIKNQILILNKQINGEELTLEEQKFMQELQERQQADQLPLSDESRANKQRFDSDQQSAKFQINHITDLHNSSDSFEALLLTSLKRADHLEYDEKGRITAFGSKEKLKDGVSIAITGDVGTDFFDQQNHGLEAFLSETIVDKGGYESQEGAELKELYLSLMHMAGLDEEMIRTMNPEAFGEGGPFQKFHSYLFGISDPGFLTEEEKEDFRQRRDRLHELLKKGMKYHARKEYNEIKDTLDKYGFTPDEVAFVSGNHDIPEIMEEILGDYLIKPGQTREVSGLKFGNVIDSASGNFTGGPYFNDIFGYAGLREELEYVEHSSDAFKAIKNELDSVGVKMTDREISKYMDISMQKAAMGIGTGAAGEYKVSKIKPILEEHVKNRTLAIKKNLPMDADVILQHSMIDHPQNSGIEERAAHELLAKHLPGAVVLHGHEHAPTPHRKDGIKHLNPGSAASGNSAIHLFDEGKNYSSSLFKTLDEGLNDVYRHMRSEELPGHPSGRYQAS